MKMSIAEIREKVEVLKEIKVELSISHYESDELEELCEHLGEDDFTIELDGAEYRFIDESAIDGIYEDAIRDLVEECYFACRSKEFPWWIEIDWAATAQNCMHGHTFATYDGSEYNVDGYFIFRTN
jgi:hypothetical protein